MSEAGFKTTSLGMSDKGVLEVGGVFMKVGGNAGGTNPGAEIAGGIGGVLVADTIGSTPAARNRPSMELGSGPDAADEVLGGAGGF